MKMLKFFVSAMVVLVIVVFGLIFGFHNNEAITVDFLVFKSSSMGIGFWMLLSLLLGAILGWLISLPKVIFLKISNQRQQLKVNNQEAELSRLKGLPLKGK